MFGKIEIPSDMFVVLPELIYGYDRPHTIINERMYITLRDDAHEWIMENVPNGFYQLSAETISVPNIRSTISGATYGKIATKVFLRTYDDSLLLFKLSCF